MPHMGVVGTGPVGLAMAHQAKLKGFDVTLFGNDNGQALPELAWRFRPTHPAAAAFWTPFCSGVTPEIEGAMSKLTLKFYHDLVKQPVVSGSKDHGVRLRVLEQHFVADHVVVPPWKDHEGLKFKRSQNTLRFTEHTVVEKCGLPSETAPQKVVRIRREFSYTAPVIQVDLFIPWYLNMLRTDLGIKYTEVSHPFVGTARLPTPSIAECQSKWRELLHDHQIDYLVICTGIGTYFGEIVQKADNFIPKKGVVAHLPIIPPENLPVILFEGAFFDNDTLYMVPLVQRLLLGGTVHTVTQDYCDGSWEVTAAEKDAILARAKQFLPREYKRLLTPTAIDQLQWQAGVRPMISNSGPICRHSHTLSAFYQSNDKPQIYLNFGHGGSGFTFCHDTAQLILEQIENQHFHPPQT